MTELAVQTKTFDLSPQTFEQALTFANYLADSDMVPKDFKGKPANCLIGMQWGMELGMKPLQAIQNIAVINGRPNLWGDAMLALVRSSPLCEYVTEDWHADGTAFCKAKRRGESEQIRTFSDADAKLAGLLGKQGPWTTGPKRMKQLRARGFALRDVFTDVLRGMGMAEEALDVVTMNEPKHMGPVEIVPSATTVQATWDDAKFAVRLPKWKAALVAGDKTVEEVIAFALTKGALTNDQLEQIKALPAQIMKDDEPRKTEGRTGPSVSYAQIADAMRKAADMDALNDAANLIEAITDRDQQVELNAMYHQCAEALS